jgi:hypothetical protein
VTRVRIRTLLLAAVALLVAWYFVGGRDEIAWREYVRHSKSQGGWDLSQADRWPSHANLLFVLGLGIYSGLAVSALRGIGILAKKFSETRGQ